MKREQITYLSKRVKAIAESKRAELNRQINYDGFRLEWEEKYKLIKSGKAKIKEFKDLYKYTDVSNAFIFPGELEFLKERDSKNHDLKARISKVSEEELELLDSINIEEDAKKFLALLTKFENKKF